MAAFDFAPLLGPGLPAPAARWSGLAKYSFVGGNNDADAVPVEGLRAAADAVLAREGRALATYGLAHGPQGYRPLRDFLATKLARDAGREVREEAYAIDQWRADAKSGKLKEAFACGTAAVISPIGKVRSASGDVLINGGEAGPVAMGLRKQLVDIQ
ncbi:MAG: hypothetical protein E6417_16435, partial [Bradyrhizobium sp.]|nr:hypothetical protein [Bradyrhizobium sp.]